MKIKKMLYKSSIIIFIIFVSYLIVSFPFQYTQDKMNNVSQAVRWLGALLFFLICFCLVKYRKWIEKILNKEYLFVIILALIVILQLAAIVTFKIQPINDLLYLHDEAIRMLQSPQVSLERFRHYFAWYPNNYGHLMLLYCYYKILSFLGIGTKYFVLAGNVLNLVVIDLGIICGYKALRYLKNTKMANLWMILFLLNPWTYFWISYYYTHTVSFGIMMVLFLLFVLVWKEKETYKGIVYSFLLGLTIYIGIKIRITNLIIVIAVLMAVFFFWKKEKIRGKQVVLVAAIVCGTMVSFAGYQYKARDMFPKQNAQEFPATHWLMMASHGVGRYDNEDVRFTSELPTQEEKKEMTVQKMKENYKNLGLKGSLKLFGTKLKAVWLVGDDDFTKMTYVSSDYRKINQYLNGKYNGWILMYSYLTRIALLCGCLVSAVNLIHKKDKWEYAALLCVLGGMVFHLFWEANPKYSICFMGMMTFLMVSGMEAFSQRNLRETGLCQRKNIPIYLIIVGLVVSLQPAYNYLVHNPEPYDRAYAANQYTESKSVLLAVKKGDAMSQSFCAYVNFNEIQIRIRNVNQTSNIRFCLKNKKTQELESTSLSKVVYDGNTVVWNLKKQYKPGKYMVEVVFYDQQENIILPIYETANYDAYKNGSLYIQGKRKKDADLVFSVSD